MSVLLQVSALLEKTNSVREVPVKGLNYTAEIHQKQLRVIRDKLRWKPERAVIQICSLSPNNPCENA